MAKILISGGSGLVGRAVSELFVKNGHTVVWLGRKAGSENGFKKFRWDVERSYIDQHAFEGVDTLIHLAGAGITDHRWTDDYKKKIVSSRVKSSELLFSCISKYNFPIKSLVGASAVGYYGSIRSHKVFSEDDMPGSDFLARCCVKWENSYESFIASGIRTSILRTSMVLSNKGGAYQKLKPLFAWGLGAAFGDGRQHVPWIHIDDLAAMYVTAALKPGFHGVYNAVAPEIATNKQFAAQLAKSLHRPLIIPNVPKAMLKLILGESHVVLTEGSEISSQKIRETGFVFRYNQLHSALHELAR